MEYSEYEKYKGFSNQFKENLICSCDNCGIEVENENYLTSMNHKRYGIIKVCGVCKSYLKRTQKLEN